MKALISVYDKRGLKDFASKLKNLGFEIISTGGTYDHLNKEGFHPIKLSDFCGSPELLGGRVKSLHPSVFAGILAREDQENELLKNKLCRIDLVCCNLYPFTETLKNSNDDSNILENIDIGGAALLRAAAKNYKKVITVSSPDDYEEVAQRLSGGGDDEKFRKNLAAAAFRMVSIYDSSVSEYLSGVRELKINEQKTSELRYGENPHQKAALYGSPPYRMIAGEKELSFNNYQDMDAAVRIAESFKEPAAAVIKHAVPCGAAVSDSILEAFIHALSGDPVSAFGGIIGLNRPCTEELASEITKTFFEVVAAPDYSDASLEVFKKKPNLRVVKTLPLPLDDDIRKISGGFLIQSPDDFEGEEWKIVTTRKPSKEEMADLKVAWKISAYLKSNAIALVRGGKSIGLGSGQTSRVDAVRIAVDSMRRRGGEERNPVLASDGFFPFPDAVEESAAAGVVAIVQPGGSKNDELVIQTAEKLGISMVITGRRHFLH